MAVEKWKQFNVKSCCVSSMHQVNCDKNYFSRRILNRKASYQGLVRQYCTKKIVNQRKNRGFGLRETSVCSPGSPLTLVEAQRNYFASQNLPPLSLQPITPYSPLQREKGSPQSQPQAGCTPSSFRLIYIHISSCLFSSREWRCLLWFPLKTPCSCLSSSYLLLTPQSLYLWSVPLYPLLSHTRKHSTSPLQNSSILQLPPNSKGTLDSHIHSQSQSQKFSSNSSRVGPEECVVCKDPPGHSLISSHLPPQPDSQMKTHALNLGRKPTPGLVIHKMPVVTAVCFFSCISCVPCWEPDASMKTQLYEAPSVLPDESSQLFLAEPNTELKGPFERSFADFYSN